MNKNNNLAINAKSCIVIRNSDDHLMFDPDGLLQIYNKITDEVVPVELNEEIINLFNLTDMSDNEKNGKQSDQMNISNDVETDETDYIDEEYLEDQYQSDADVYNDYDELQNADDGSTSQPSSSSEHYFKKHARWTNSADLALISLFGENKNDYFGTKIRKMTVWNEISAELANCGHKYTAYQCRGRFGRLDMKYHEKRDNMRNKSSGAAAMSFKYFDEFEDIFGKKPNIDPKFLISSRRQIPKTSPVTSNRTPVTTSQGQNSLKHKQVTSIKDENVKVLTSPVAPLKAKKRVTPSDIFQRDIDNQAAREKRHQEKLEIKRQAAMQLSRMADILEQRFSK